MKTLQTELTNWAIENIKNNYAEDIALLIAVDKHHMPNDCHGLCFDYYIPATNRGYEMAKTFILEGVGYDLYPRSWERIDNMANFKDDFHNGLADAIVLYARTEEDLERFENYRTKLKSNLKDTHFMYKKALEKLDAAMTLYQTLMFEEKLHLVKMGAGYIAYFLSQAIAFTNGTYFKEKLELPTLELKTYEHIPEDFISLYEQIVFSQDLSELQELSHKIIHTTRKFLLNYQVGTSKKTAIDYNHLAEWYHELSLTFRRIYTHCDDNQPLRAFNDIVFLQGECNIISDEFDLRPIDLLSDFSPNTLSSYKTRVQSVENEILVTLKANGITLNQYTSLDDFLKNN